MFDDPLDIRVIEVDEKANQIDTIATTSNQLIGRAAFKETVRLFPTRRFLLLQRARTMAKHNSDG